MNERQNDGIEKYSWLLQPGFWLSDKLDDKKRVFVSKYHETSIEEGDRSPTVRRSTRGTSLDERAG